MNLPVNLLNVLFEGRIVAEQPLATCSKDLADTRRSSTDPLPIPSMTTGKGVRMYFPATGLRGGWRRALHQLMREHLIALTGNPTPLTLNEHYISTIGGVKGSGEANKASVMHIAKAREQNPLLSLFGAGDAGSLGFVRGKINIGNAIVADEYADIAAVHFSGARSDEFFRSPEQTKYLSEDDLSKLLQQGLANRARSKIQNQIDAMKRDLKKFKDRSSDEYVALNDEIKKLEAEAKEVVKASEASDNSVGMPLAGFLAIPPMVEMNHKIRIVQATRIELGAFLGALRQFSANPLVGAHHNTGCGEISGTWDVYSMGAGERVKLGSVTMGFGHFVIDGDVLKEADDEFAQLMRSGNFSMAAPTLE